MATADLSTAPTTMACWVRRSSRLLGLTSKRSDKLWRSRPVRLARRVLTTPRLQTRFQTANEEAAATMLRQLIRLPHNLHPWGESWQEAVSATRIPLHLPVDQLRPDMFNKSLCSIKLNVRIY